MNDHHHNLHHHHHHHRDQFQTWIFQTNITLFLNESLPSAEWREISVADICFSWLPRPSGTLFLHFDSSLYYDPGPPQIESFKTLFFSLNASYTPPTPPFSFFHSYAPVRELDLEVSCGNKRSTEHPFCCCRWWEPSSWF